MDPVLSRLSLAADSDVSLAGQLHDRLVVLIADGVIPPGMRLPAVRPAARHLGISINTVRAAYARLERDGLVATRQGAGTTVVSILPSAVRTESGQLRSGVVGVLVAGLDPFYVPLLRAIEEVADRHGLLVLVADTEDSPERAESILRRLIARRVDGIIAVSIGPLAMGLSRDAGSRTSAPRIVYIDWPVAADHSFVFDAEQGAYEATRHLAEHGHERIGFVTAPLSWANIAPLHTGYLRALTERGWTPDSALVVETAGFTVEAGRNGLTALLAVESPPAAVFVGTGVLALGLVDEARRRRLRIPDDLAVIAYTDPDAAALMEPPITAVAVPVHEIGIQAMTTLAALMEGASVEVLQTTFKGELIVRESCGLHGPISAHGLLTHGP